MELFDPEDQLDVDQTLKAPLAPSSQNTPESAATLRGNRVTRPNVERDEGVLPQIQSAAIARSQLNPANSVYRNSLPVSAPPPPPLERESAARERMRRRAVNGRSKGGEWAWVIIGAALLGVVVLVSLSMFLVLRMSRENTEVLPTADFAFSQLPTPVNLRNGGTGGGQTLVFSDGTSVELKAWDGESRLTILLIGLDRRPGEEGLGFRTDTLMLVSLDPKTSRVGVLSIPRDLYVEVPGFYGTRRINEAMVLGELRQAGTGPQVTMQAIQYNLGIRVHNYIIVDFQAFIGIVDAIGGIEVTTDYTISDNSYPSMNYGYDPFYLAAGEHTLDGATALKFARTRHGDNDFERAERQQQVLYAIRDKVATPEMLPQLLAQSPAIWDALRENIYTGLRVDELIQIGLYIKDIPQTNITTGVIDYKFTTPFTTSDGAQVLIPNRARIGTLMEQVFGVDFSQ